MTTAYWCILAAVFLPYLATAVAKFSGSGYGPAANADPRTFLAGLQGFRRRANAAQLNGFEAAPAFAAAVIVAHLAGQASQSLIDLLALGWVVCRLIYLICYLANWAMLRSLVWAAGMAIVVALFVVSA